MASSMHKAAVGCCSTSSLNIFKTNLEKKRQGKSKVRYNDTYMVRNCTVTSETTRAAAEEAVYAVKTISANNINPAMMHFSAVLGSNKSSDFQVFQKLDLKV